MSYGDVNNNEEIIDSRDIIKRIAELEDIAVIDREEDEQEELDTLYDLQKECENVTSEWNHGATLIREDYFEDYAKQLADDLGLINADAGWPNSFINWKAAADALKQDYSEVDYDGVTYFIRD